MLDTTSSASPTIAAAQQDMRTAYLGGAPGLFVSGFVWAIAGVVCLMRSPQTAVWALYVGGALIHPVAGLLTRLLGSSGRHAAGNPLGTLALATTIWMIMILPLAYGISLWRIELFFPAMLFVIGGRYLTFATLFGRKLFRVCGAVLGLAGYLLAARHAAPFVGAFTGAVIEITFGGILAAGLRNARAATPASA
ncbi:hypothetical protein NX784_22200 [Massilia pinisoli]|uniref:Uncharacterized protein n=1 Tax=Massilia pinisoli TaxID=1772194 RepID=A0ABT1ZWI5_9BURK|nr:hypothetical protein [Massilia pinisoli]MCS0584306.1 hypothetical protein [Massilia pinisoli]